MQTLKNALRETERIVARRDPSLYFNIKSLQKNSPANVTLEAVSDDEGESSTPQYASRVVRSLTTNLRIIANKRAIPRGLDVPALESYRDMAISTDKHGVDVKLQTGNHSVLINSQFGQILDSIIGEDEFSYGSVSGKIEAINLHHRNRRFQIFPTVGPSRVVGTFLTKDRKAFANSLDKYVTVFGRLRYKTWDRFPYAISAHDITVHDITVDGLDQIKGIAPEATGQLTSQEFIDRLNDEW